MSLVLSHTLVSAVVDNGVAGEVGPSEWNDNHVTSMATARILGRVTAATGVIEELTQAQARTFIDFDSPPAIGATVAAGVNATTFTASSTASFLAAANFLSTSTSASFTNINAGATGVILVAFHDSSSPAPGDLIRFLQDYGRNSAAAQYVYAQDYVSLDDATAGSEDASRVMQTSVAGVQTTHISFTATGVTVRALKPNAGTTALPPILFTTGTNLTTATAGAIEYDGKCLYGTLVASSRSVFTLKQIACATAVVALTNNIATAQSIFQAANDTLTLAANTTYRFRARLGFNTGATTHTTAFGLGGTATFTSVGYLSQATSSAANTLATTQQRRVATAAAAVLTATSVAVTTDIWIDGLIRTANAGTIIPQVTFSAGPTGTCETAIDSFFEIEPIGVDTLAAIGNWS